MKEEYHFW